MRHAMDGGGSNANSDWTRVTKKRRERGNSTRKDSVGSVAAAGPSKPVLASKPQPRAQPRAQPGVVKRRWTKMQPPSLPKSTSIIRNQNVLLLNQWYSRLHTLPQNNSKEMISFLASNWETFKALMKLPRFHNETASVVEAMAVLSECDEFREVEFVIIYVLLGIKIFQLPTNCQGVRFFLTLCRIFSSFLERGSPQAAKWIHGRRWVLITFGEACKYLSDKGKDGELVLGKLQALDVGFSQLREPSWGDHSKTLIMNKSTVCPGKLEISPSTSINGFADSNNNYVATHKRDETTDTGVWHKVGPKKKVVSNGKQSSYAPRADLSDPPLALTPKSGNQSHAAGSAPGRSKIAEACNGLITRLRRNWNLCDLPSYLEDIMKLISRMRSAKMKLDSFISDVCKTPVVNNLRDFLLIRREIGVPSTTFHQISQFCFAVSRACPDPFYEHFKDIVESALQVADSFSQEIHVQHAKKQILELHGMFVHTIYVLDKPQDHFRYMFVQPMPEDFENRTFYLRPNIVSGPFPSVEDYLDVQFRLLREDFIKPLRNGVAELRGRIKVFERSEENRFNALRIYKNVTFEKNKQHWPAGTLIMNFDLNQSLNIDWRISKRFMMGSLLVISNDNFKTLNLALVAKRDVNCLSAGWLYIEPLWSELSAQKLCQGSFVVGESMVFFEPYRHVLTALQNISADEFPLARYIVYADPSDELPDYLQEECNRKYWIPLLGEQVVQRDIVSGEWPTAAEMGLNDSQHEALTRALTQKVMLVQGPPGTGKTFLGLRIVSTLLRNPQAWRGNDDSACPILIVCLTNHALDQFLVGLLSATKKIVRLGGRCKDERLADYMLKKNENELSRDLKRRMWERIKELENAEYELECIQMAIKGMNDNFGIVSLESFQTYAVASELSDLPAGFSIIRWLEKGIQHSALSDEDIQFIRQNPKWGSRIFTFEDTFEQIESTLVELQRLVGEGRREYERTLEYYKAKHQYLSWVVTSELAPGFEPQTENVLDLDADQRPQLYLFWVSQLKLALAMAERDAEKYMRDCKARVKQIYMLKDRELIASNLIVGMTTTKAATIQPLLQELKPRIVVVEEAAEVLESHIVAALTPAVEHLILLGDHKQLRPSPSDHVVGKDFKLEVSLFERLINNKMPCKTLNVQHRMQPKVAKLIEFIYPGLENHSSVLRYPAVKGLDSSVFFVDHQQPEQYMDELISHSNPHEAKFLAALVTYLLLQGYDDKQITILTAYAGQLMYFRGLEFDYPDLRRVRICNIDNFQGEESDIILLSLVRSNPKKNIGFLKTENRVCVALSRAKHGMIIVGNVGVLTAASETWRKVHSNLQSQEAVGTALTLRCVDHPEQTLNVSSAADFQRWTDGGCETKCQFSLGCGHSCPSSCHRNNLEHQHIVCLARCDKMVCKKDHAPYFCGKLCCDTCEPCRAEKYVRLECGHFAKMKCSEDPRSYRCRMDKTVELDCGHTAKISCSGDPSTYRCKVKEKRVLELCGHENVVECFRNGPCKVLCKAKLACGHLCERNCHKFDDPEHDDYKCSEPCLRTRPGCSAEPKHTCPLKCKEKCTDCDVVVTKSLPCHHDIRMPCCESTAAAQSRCKSKCASILPCRHPCKQPCGQECGPCEVEVQRVHPACGHKVTMTCNADAGDQICKEPCEKILESCSHKCAKVCGRSCLPCIVKVPKELPNCTHWKDLPCGTGVEDVVCTERCVKDLPCKHRCRERCADPCQTECRKLVPCPSPCGHSVKVLCHEKDKWCSEESESNLMSKCKKKCTVKLDCGHQCKGSCSECYQGRLHRVCEEKCSKILLCGHRCQEPCGLPCLPCKRPCPVRCIHSKCLKHCGERCSPCSKKCEMGKPTFKCEKKCRDQCTFIPTNNPCRLMVRKCKKHDCIGLEGDPCPSMCRICDKDSKEFASSSEEDRFLVLTDCDHIVRFDAMEKTIKETPTVVRLPSCPVCQVPVANSSRYGNLVKERQEHIAVIYKDLASCSTNLKDRIGKETQELKKLAGMSDADKRTKLLNACTAADSPNTHRLMIALCEAMEAAQRSGSSDVSARTMRGLSTYASILFMLDDCLRSVARREHTLRRKVACQVEALAAVLASRPGRVLSAHEVLDLNTELLRIQRLQQLCIVEQAYQDETDDLESDMEYRKVCEYIRGSGPYPRKTFDDAVERTIERLAADIQCDLGAQWWEELRLPRSAAQGSWYFCGKGHTYPKTGTERSCNKCPRDHKD